MHRLLDSLDMPRYGSELKKRVDCVSFVIKKLYVFLFMMKQCIYLVMQMYFMITDFRLL